MESSDCIIKSTISVVNSTIPSISTSKHKPSNEDVKYSPPVSNNHKSSSSNSSFPNRLSHSPQIVDLATCNHQRFWKSAAQNFRRYLTCFKPMKQKQRSKNKGQLSNVSVNTSRSVQSPKNCNYYSEMNDEERDEKLKSAIVYCKDSTSQDDLLQGRLT